jgi:hypothetical protein
VAADHVVGPSSRPSQAAARQAMSSAVEDLVAQTAASLAIDMASLRARVRIALFCPTATDDLSIKQIIEKEAEGLRKAQHEVAPLFVPDVPVPGMQFREAQLVHLSSETGRLISSGIHYLQSARADGWHFGLKHKQTDLLMAYACVNGLDWDVLLKALGGIDENVEPLSLSRIYVSGGAPPNTISHFLSLLVREHSASGSKATISTTVDPNLGFFGASYRASNWLELFSIPHLGYLYVDGQYCTRRQLIRIFGSDNPRDLARQLGPRFQMSGPMPSDTLVFATATNRAMRADLRRLGLSRLERSSHKESNIDDCRLHN